MPDQLRRVVIAAELEPTLNPLHGDWLVDWASAFVSLGSAVTVLACTTEPDAISARLESGGVVVRYPLRADLLGLDGAPTLEGRARLCVELGREADVVFAQGLTLTQLLAGGGELNHCLWALPIDDPLARLPMVPGTVPLLETLADGARRVLVTDTVAAGWVESSCPALASRVLRWPTWAHADGTYLDPAGAQLLLHPGFARASHGAHLEGLSEGIKKLPAAVCGVVGDEAALDGFRAGAGRALGLSLPGLTPRAALAAEPSRGFGLALGSLANQADDTSFEAATWFESHGLSPLVAVGSRADREGPTRWARLERDARQIPEPLMEPSQGRPRQALAEELAALLRPKGGAAPSRRVLLSGRDFKFAGELVDLLADSGRYEVKVHVDNATSPADRDALAQWADVIICEFALGQAVWHARNARPDQSVIVRLHGFELTSKWIDELDVSRCSAVVLVSEHYRRAAMELKGWPADKLVVIPNTVNLIDLDRPKYPEARFNLGLVGIVPALKRPDRALDLMELLLAADPRFKLHLRGNHPWQYPWVWNSPTDRLAYLRFYERIASSKALREAVSFEGFGPDMGNWYRKVGWLLSPSQRESFHLAPAEAMASGTVPVVWEREGAVEIFSERWTHAGTDAAAAFILARTGDAHYTAEARAARSFVTRYGTAKSDAHWVRLIDRAPTAGTSASAIRPTAAAAEPSLATAGGYLISIWENGAHSDARAALEALSDEVNEAAVSPGLPGADALLRAQALVRGWIALAPKVPKLLAAGAPRLAAAEPSDPLLMVTLHGSGAEARWAASAPLLRLLTVARPWCEGGNGASAEVADLDRSLLDVYVDRVVDAVVSEAVRCGARLIVTDGPVWLAAAVSAAATRLGVVFWWDVRGGELLDAISRGQSFQSTEASPVFESAYRIARHADALIVGAGRTAPPGLRSLRGRLFAVPGRFESERELWLAHRSGALSYERAQEHDGLWNALWSVPGTPRVAAVGLAPSGLEQVGAFVDRVSTQLDPELHDVLVADATTPQAFADSLPALLEARRYSIPAVVWGVPATGRALATVLVSPGGVTDEVRQGVRPLLAHVAVADDSPGSVRVALRAAGVSVDPPWLAAPELPVQEATGDFVEASLALSVVVHGTGEALASTLASLERQSLNRRLFEVVVEDAADLAGRFRGLVLRMDGRPTGPYTVDLLAGDTLDPDYLLAGWLACAPGAAVLLPTQGCEPGEPQSPGLTERYGLLRPTGRTEVEMLSEGFVLNAPSWAEPHARQSVEQPERYDLEGSLARLDVWALAARGATTETLRQALRALAETECRLRVRGALTAQPQAARELIGRLGQRPARDFEAVIELFG